MAHIQPVGGQDELSRSLRDLREAAGLAQISAAAATGTSQAGLSRFERGRSLPSPELVRTLARVYGASAAETARLVALAEAIRPEYVNQRVIMQRGRNHFQQRLSTIKASSRLVRSFHPAAILGTVQTKAVASLIFSRRGGSADEIAEGIATRVNGQSLLDDPQRQWVLVQTEGALDWCLGSTAIMAEQLDHMVTVSRRPNVKLGIIPRRTPAPVQPLHGFHIFDERAVHFGTSSGAALLGDQRDIELYVAKFTVLAELAVYGDQARAILTRIAGEYREQAETTER